MSATEWYPIDTAPKDGSSILVGYWHKKALSRDRAVRPTDTERKA